MTTTPNILFSPLQIVPKGNKAHNRLNENQVGLANPQSLSNPKASACYGEQERPPASVADVPCTKQNEDVAYPAH